MKAASFKIAVMISGQNGVLGARAWMLVPALIKDAWKSVGMYKLRVHSKVDPLNTIIGTKNARGMVTMEQVKTLP